MVYKIADNITSPLGLSTNENFHALKNGNSRICCCSDKTISPEDFVSSRFSEEQWSEILIDGYSRFESLAICSITKALAQTNVNLGSTKTILILSTTKANIELINTEPEKTGPAYAAKRIAEYFCINSKPVVACNACISGISALVLAKRLLQSDIYDTAIVCGADTLNSFTVSGFQSLKALSHTSCKPFDIERLGLNLGEASATLILRKEKEEETKENEEATWFLESEAISNDGFHITNPSPKGLGCAKAMQNTIKDLPLEELAVVNAHGTATMFNDQMESRAIESAGLQLVPVNALKGYYGHTLGAAGIIETIITMKSLDNHIVLGTRGFEELGVSGRINISKENNQTDKFSFLKIISGFGGCNGALLCTKGKRNRLENDNLKEDLIITHTVKISPYRVMVDNQELYFEGKGMDILTYLYKNYIGNYSKFYKMDILCRLGFVASELLLQSETGCKMNEGRIPEIKNCKKRFVECDNRAIILFNSSSSICADKEYNKTIRNKQDYFPSPSVFVYTLPNIVTGEIAIRNLYHGETSFYIMPENDETLQQNIVRASLTTENTESCICGWINANSESDFETDLYIIEKSK